MDITWLSTFFCHTLRWCYWHYLYFSFYMVFLRDYLSLRLSPSPSLHALTLKHDVCCILFYEEGKYRETMVLRTIVLMPLQRHGNNVMLIQGITIVIAQGVSNKVMIDWIKDLNKVGTMCHYTMVEGDPRQYHRWDAYNIRFLYAITWEVQSYDSIVMWFTYVLNIRLGCKLIAQLGI